MARLRRPRIGWILIALSLAACARRPASPGLVSGEATGGTASTSDAAPAPDAVAPEPSAAAPSRLIGIVSPHAGYDYSGAVAAWAWALLSAPGSPVAAPPAADDAFPSQVAGRFYPADPAELRSAVEGYLAAVPARTDVAPGEIRAVVVLSPSHRHALAKIALPAASAFRTPLGDVPVDRALRARLLAELPDDVEINADAFLGEHAMEDQLPFLQVVRPGALVLPVIVGQSETDRLERLGRALGRLLKDDAGVRLAVSSDMSHFYAYDEAVAYDSDSLATLTALDLGRLDRIGPQQSGLCGYYPLRAALVALQEVAGAGARVVQLKYANSGDVTGERDRVVGYGALALLAAGEPGTAPVGAEMQVRADAPEGGTMYTREERQALMDLAKAAVRAAVNREQYDPEPPALESLRRDGAAFVTLKEHGELRGCIGHIIATMPLYRCVVEVATAAATEDYRFDPVRPDELPLLTYEISVLTPPEPVADPTSIVVGRDGLIMSRGRNRGLLLPQVPGEQGWDREQFLEGTCRKAGLPVGCWRDPQTRIERFQAIVWGEDLEDSLE